jgi:hypothetical protein
MSPSAARNLDMDSPLDPAPAERFLPLQLAQSAAATSQLVADGLAMRGLGGESIAGGLTGQNGALPPEVALLARAYEDALMVSFTPAEVQTLRRLLARVEAAALKLSGRG